MVKVIVKKKQPKVRVMKKKAEKKQEMTVLGGALRALGGLGGSALGSLIGQPTIGGSIGSGLGATLSRWLGSGDYAVRQNSLVTSMKTSGSIPMMHKQGQSVIVRHKEYITDVIAGTGTPTAFNVFNTYPLNPGMASTFPWLSTIAQQFQEYTARGIVFHYISTSGESVASTNTALGSVMCATQYRATAPAFTNKQVMLNEYFSSDGKPSESFCHPIECDPKENPYNVQYVRSGAVSSSEDLKTYDLGEFSIATEGVPSAGVNIGELWVSYEIELRKPIVTGLTDQNGLAAHYTSANPSSTNVLGSSRTKVIDTIGLTFPTNTTVAFPMGSVGTYMVQLWYQASSALSTPSVALTNCTSVGAFSGGNGNEFFSYTSAVGQGGGGFYMATVNIADPTLAAKIVYTVATISGSPTLDLTVTQVNSSFT